MGGREVLGWTKSHQTLTCPGGAFSGRGEAPGRWGRAEDHHVNTKCPEKLGKATVNCRGRRSQGGLPGGGGGKVEAGPRE